MSNHHLVPMSEEPGEPLLLDRGMKSDSIPPSTDRRLSGARTGRAS
jgi:hypothetical protein